MAGTLNLFDSHAHLLDDRFDNDRDALCAALPDLGVKRLVNVACEVSEFGPALDLSARYPHIYTAVGAHPHGAERMREGDLDIIRDTLQRPKVVALGEIGLDFHYDFSPREVQRARFVEQLLLANQCKKPAVLHIREAHGEALELLTAHKNELPKGVMHCYSGSYDMAKQYMALGFYISFSGSVTFKNARKLFEVAQKLPTDSILIETDCPYLAPEPHRGKRNQPDYTAHVAEAIARAQNKDVKEIADTTFRNACKLFNIN